MIEIFSLNKNIPTNRAVKGSKAPKIEALVEPIIWIAFTKNNKDIIVGTIAKNRVQNYIFKFVSIIIFELGFIKDDKKIVKVQKNIE